MSTVCTLYTYFIHEVRESCLLIFQTGIEDGKFNITQTAKAGLHFQKFYSFQKFYGGTN